MMKLFAVRDVKADAFGAVMVISTVGIAIRSFSDACADARSEFAKYPEDYMLYEIGTFEPNSGLVTALQMPKLIVTAHAIIEQLRIARSGNGGPVAPVALVEGSEVGS